MTDARHYAEKVQATLNAIAEAEDRKVDALCVRRDSDAYEEVRRELHGLHATLLLHAANLVTAVLAERAPHVCANCAGTDPASCWNNGSAL